MKSLINGIGGGFGRSIGRVLGLIFIGYLIYLAINYFGIDIKSIIPNINLETQGLSRKVDRGKHTTRVNELYIYNDIMIADTPGFSNLELDIDYKELASFYPEFDDYLGTCKYLDCSHVKEGKDCSVVSAVTEGKINKDRYDRYCDLYGKLKVIWENKYD